MINAIQDKIRSRRYELSRHALDQSIKRSTRHQAMRETMIKPRVTYTVEHAGKLYVIENVPARVGQETVEHIQAIIAGSATPVRVIEAPVYDDA